MSLIFYHVPLSTSTLTMYLGAMRVDLEPFPALVAWLERCHRRPALARLMAG